MQKNNQVINSENQKLGDISVEVHRIFTKDKAELAITHISPGKGNDKAPVVVLLHGTYSKRNFWISPKGIGMGSFLAENGCDVWIPELRGHGLSPKGKDFSAITAEEQIRFDIPAIQEFVHIQTNAPLFWIGHSFGGVYFLASLACNWLKQDMIRGAVTFGSQISKGESYLKIPPIAWLCAFVLRRLGYFPATKLGMGPEIESAGSMLEVIRWKEFRGKWINSEGYCYWDGMSRILLPVLAFAAAKDKNDPPEGCKKLYDSLGSPDRAFILLGKKEGFLKDYDHIGMVVSKEAQAEIWPRVVKWLYEH